MDYMQKGTSVSYGEQIIYTSLELDVHVVNDTLYACKRQLSADYNINSL